MKSTIARLVPCLVLTTLAAFPGAGCEVAEEAGLVSFTLSWSEPPEEPLWIWARVEAREPGEVSGPILSSAEPALYVPGEGLELTLPTVANGDGRVLVVEAREGESLALRVVAFGVSAPFSVVSGKVVVVDVPLVFEKPAGDVVEPVLSISVPGKAQGKARADELHAVDVHLEASGIASVVLANDPSFAAGFREVDLGDAAAIACTEEERDGATWKVCDLAGWDLLEGVPEDQLLDGPRTLFARFVDALGYDSSVRTASVLLDASPPAVLSAAISPEVAGAESEVHLAVSFSEPLAEASLASALAIAAADGDAPSLTAGPPSRVGDSNTYDWILTTGTGDEGRTYSFSLSVEDEAGNPAAIPLGPTLLVDGVAPKLAQSDVSTDPVVLDPGGAKVLALAHGGLLTVEVLVLEPGGFEEGSPAVQILSAPAIDLAPAPGCVPAAGLHKCTFELVLDESLHEKQEGVWPLQLVLRDAAGNATVVAGAALGFVRLDFSPPEAECGVASTGTPPLGIGAELLVQVQPLEPVRAPDASAWELQYLPPWPGAAAALDLDPANPLRARIPVVEGQPEGALTIHVHLEDLVGNATSKLGTACSAGPITMQMDGVRPEILSIVVAGPSPWVRAGSLVTGEVAVSGAGAANPPAVALGGEAMEVAGPEVTGPGVLGWKVSRTLDGSESEGAAVVEAIVFDDAGNAGSLVHVDPALTLDFHAPLASCFSSPEFAKATSVLKVSATFSEPIDPATLALVSPEVSFGLEPAGGAGGVESATWTAPVPEGAGALWSYQVSAADLAGNPAAPACTGGGTIDAVPIEVTASFVEASHEGPGGTVTTGVHVGPKSVVSFGFNLSEAPAPGTLAVTLAGATANLVTSDGLSYTGAFDVAELGLGHGPSPLVAGVEDAAGNLTFAQLAVLDVDLNPPVVVGLAAFAHDLPLADPLPPNDLVLPATGVVVHVSAAVNEALGPGSAAEVGGVEFVVTEGDPDLAFDLTAPSAGGDWPVTLTAVDAVGNAAGWTLGTLHVDGTPPSGLADLFAARLRRIPFGADETGGVPATLLRVCPAPADPGPGWDFCDGKVSPLEPGTTLRVYAAVESDAGPSCTSKLLAAEKLPGAAAPLELDLPGDWPWVCVEAEDAAGNVGPREVVPRSDLVVTPYGKVPGLTSFNPTVLERTSAFLPSRRQRTGLTAEATASQIAAASTLGGAVASVSAADALWRLHVPAESAAVLPEGRNYGHLVHAPPTGVDMLLGGALEFAGGETWWHWDGRRWIQQIQVTDSPAHITGGMVYHDPHRERIVAWGLSLLNADPTRVWEYDPSSGKWSSCEPALVPSGRLGGAPAYDPYLRRGLYFGGTDFTPGVGIGDMQGDFWAYDAALCEFTLLEEDCGTSACPGPRFGATLAFDLARDEALLSGGDRLPGDDATTDLLGDLWRWTDDGWSLVTTKGSAPAPRRAHTMVYDPVRDRFHLYGGRLATSVSAEVFELDPTLDPPRWTLVPPSEPGAPARHAAAVAFDLLRDRLVLFGGADTIAGGDLTETWEYLLAEARWTQRAQVVAVPTKRAWAAVATEPASETILVHGGTTQDKETDALSTLQRWNGETEQWTSVATTSPPSSRLRHAMAVDEARDALVLFGGKSPGSGALTGTYELDLANLKWKKVVGAEPPARRDHRMVYAPELGGIVLFGGRGVPSGAYLDDLWLWNGAVWAPLDAGPGPSGRGAFGFTVDEDRGVAVLFGGEIEGGFDCETWELDLAEPAWTLRHPGGAGAPLPTIAAGFAWVPSRARTILQGGVVEPKGGGVKESATDAIYAWDGDAGTWAQLAPPGAGPGPTWGHAFAADPRTGDAVAYSGIAAFGTEEGVSEGTWILDVGASFSPAFVATVPLVEIGVPGGAAVDLLDVRVFAGGAGGAGSGAALYGWSPHLGWKALDAHGGGPEAPGLLQHVVTGAAALGDAFGISPALELAVAPTHPTGSGDAPAEVSLDAISIEIGYGAPAPANPD